ncbi:acid phosphatase [Acinetobacter faecalis]|uniref:acid phosphatase n=1 Tax=Acinetobacter faecalis TaxID=2665161 RepID=UPI002A91D452|nr:phosphatase PAP2 family protein [Acinetobacter faecalis]MDY6462829.1 phosphatase PAP2 family protein [Acinetobacter faecalis]
MQKTFKASIIVSLIIGSIAITGLSITANAADGYLTESQVPNSLKNLPLPPQENSAGQVRDNAIFQDMQAQKGTARWAQAAIDADLTDEHLGRPFSEAFGLEINEKNTPTLFSMMQKIRSDSNVTTKSAKQHYNRKRPFISMKVSTCTPQDESTLKSNGSYPSGHTTIGWTYALLLAELRPDRQDEIIQRGYEYGQSRVVCNMHWQSDVDAGRVIEAAQFARLQADSQFQKDLKRAKQELERLVKVK